MTTKKVHYQLILIIISFSLLCIEVIDSEGVSLYNRTTEINKCQEIHKIWLYDSDHVRKIDAGKSFIMSDCNDKIIRDTQNLFTIDNNICSFFQKNIDIVSNKIKNELITNQRELKDDRDVSHLISQYLQDNIDETKQKQFFMVLAAFAEWQGSASKFFSSDNYGDIKENWKENFQYIYESREDEEILKEFCPTLSFPDFYFWNDVITNQK